MSNTRMAVRLNVTALLGAVALTSVGVAGCDPEAERDLDERAQIDCNGLDGSIDGGAVDGADAGVDGGGDAGGPIVGIDSGLQDPHIRSVTANGTGCPAGTWTADVSPDGQEVTVRLSAFELEVAPQNAISVKDCQLGIAISEVADRQVQLSGVSFKGVAYLEDGVSGRLQVDRYLSGAPDKGETWRTDLRGPVDQELALADPGDSTLWSPCGAGRLLNIRVTGRLTNSASPQRNGFLKLDHAQVFRLTTRTCP